MKKILTFRVNAELYCFEVNSVVSIDQKTHVTEIPLSPKHVEGVINLRGQIIPVIDMRKLFNFEKIEAKEQCYIFVETEAGRLGCIVDAVCDVIEVSAQELVQTSEAMAANTSVYIDQILKIKEQIHFKLSPVKLYESISNLDLNTNNENPEGKAA